MDSFRLVLTQIMSHRSQIQIFVKSYLSTLFSNRERQCLCCTVVSLIWQCVCTKLFFFLSYLHRVPKQSKEEFLIKWRDVPYNQSTWERPDDAVNSQIRLAKRPFYNCKASLGVVMSVVCISNTVIFVFWGVGQVPVDI